MAEGRHAPEGQASLNLGSPDRASSETAMVDKGAPVTGGTDGVGSGSSQTAAPRAETPPVRFDAERADGAAPRPSEATAGADEASAPHAVGAERDGGECAAPAAPSSIEVPASRTTAGEPEALATPAIQVAADAPAAARDAGGASSERLPGDLEAALAQVQRAASDWGIRSDLMEGRFVSALMAAIRAVGQISEAAQAEFQEIARKGQEVARTEYEQARELVRAASTALAQARTAQVLAQTEKESLVGRMIEQTLPLFAENMRKVLVIREQRWNRDRLRRRYALAGFLVLGIFLAGYGVRAWADKGDVGFAEQCLSQPIASRGHVYCDMTPLAGAASQAGR
jgi:hypothetical protein